MPASPLRSSRDGKSGRTHISLDKLSVLQGFVQQTQEVAEEAQRQQELEAELMKDARTRPDRNHQRDFSTSVNGPLSQWKPPSTSTDPGRPASDRNSPFRFSVDSIVRNSSQGGMPAVAAHPMLQSWDLSSDSIALRNQPAGTSNTNTTSNGPGGNLAVANAAAALRSSMNAWDSPDKSGGGGGGAAGVGTWRPSTSHAGYGATGSSPMANRQGSGLRTPDGRPPLAAGMAGGVRSGTASPGGAMTRYGSARPGTSSGAVGPAGSGLQSEGGSGTSSPWTGAGTGRTRPTGTLAERTSSVPGADGVDTGGDAPPSHLTPHPPPRLAPPDLSLQDLTNGERRTCPPGGRNHILGRPSLTSTPRSNSETGGPVAPARTFSRNSSMNPRPPSTAAPPQSSLAPVPPSISRTVSRQTSVRNTPSCTPGLSPGSACPDQDPKQQQQQQQPSPVPLGAEACPWDPQKNPAGHFVDEPLAGEGGWKKLNFNTTGSVQARMAGLTAKSHAAAQEGRTTQKSALLTQSMALPETCGGDSTALRFQTVAGAVVNSWTTTDQASGMGPMGSTINATNLPGTTIKSKYQFRSSGGAGSGAASGAASPMLNGRGAGSGAATPGGGTRPGMAAAQAVAEPPAPATIVEEEEPYAVPGKKKFSFSDLVYQATGLSKKGMGRGFRKDVTVDPVEAANAPSPGQLAAQAAASWLKSTRVGKGDAPTPDTDPAPATVEDVPRPETAAAPPTNPAPYLNIAYYKQQEQAEREAAAAAAAAAAAKDNPLTGLAAAAAILRAQAAKPQTPAGPSDRLSPGAGVRSPFQDAQDGGAGGVRASMSGVSTPKSITVITGRRSASMTGEYHNKDTYVINTEVLAEDYAALRATLGDNHWPALNMSRTSSRDPVESARMRAGQQQRDKQFRSSATRLRPLLMD